MNIYRKIAVLSILLLWSAGCTVNETAPAVSSTSKLQILCTTGMLSDPLQDLIGSEAEIKTLMGPGVDPHLYKPSPGDVRQINASDLVIYHGHHLEGRMADALERAEGMTRDGRSRRAVAVSERIAVDQLIITETGTVDPHLWMDISLWRQVAWELHEILIEIDPDNSEQLKSNIEQLDQELVLLDKKVAELIDSIPESKRVLVTAHDAFGYFGKKYGLEVIGIQGISTESEASIKRVNSLVEMLTERKIPAVFVESTVPERNVRALIEGCSALGHTLKIGGVLYSDAPGPPGSGADRWRDMVLHNARVISKALQ